MPMDKGLITAQDSARALGISVETVWRYTHERKIPFIELNNRQYRYYLDAVINTLSRINKKYTYQDYLELPEEAGYRFEILDGELVKEPSPNVPHQRVSRRLQRVLEDYFVEVLSPSTTRKDRLKKMQIYQRAKIKHC